MLVYNYDEKTKEFISAVEAYLNPEETKVQGREIYLVPANATTEVPNKTGENQVNIFEVNRWIVKDDFRGQKMVDKTMIPESVNFIGALPEGYVLITEEQVENIKIKGRNYYIIENNELVINPDYEQEQAEKREADFKSKFFEVQGYGWYRKQPKGYQSAVESMNVLFNIANVTDGIQAGLIIFYQQPDFTKPEECTEEWLVAHQIIQPAMTKVDFMNLYVAFMTAWNEMEH
jgi:hypothetical protein